jgi:hypothetical protein
VGWCGQAEDDHSPLSNFVLLCIFLNVLLLTMDGYGISARLAFYIQLLSTIFTYVFIAEAVFKIVVMGLIDYFSQFSNVFDFFVISGSILEITLTNMGSVTTLR